MASLGRTTIVATKVSPAYQVVVEGLKISEETIMISTITKNAAFTTANIALPFSIGQQVTYETISNYFMTDLLFDNTNATSGATSVVIENAAVKGTLADENSSGVTVEFIPAAVPFVNNSTSVLTIRFSKAVTGFAAGDLTFAAGASIGTVSSADGGITWTGTVTTTASPGTPVTITIAQNACTSVATGKPNLFKTATFART